MQKEVEQHIRILSNIDLLEYTKSKTYRAEAIEFAKEELSKRELSSNQLAALEHKLEQRAKTQTMEMEAAASDPLPTGWRVAIFLCGLFLGIPLLLFLPAWFRFREEGARRKNRDMWIFALVGLGLQTVAVALHIPPWSWLLAWISKAS